VVARVGEIVDRIGQCAVITGGERQSRAGAICSVPKDLIAGVQMAMEKGELRVARRLGEVGALVKEMLNVRITAGLALACWRARRREIGFVNRRLPGI
jgi:hypothetical protein